MPARALTVLLLLGVIVVPSSATAAPAPAPAPAPHTTTGANARAWGPPLDGALTVTRPFERLPHPYAAGHRGVDLLGTPARAFRETPAIVPAVRVRDFSLTSLADAV